MQHYIRNKKAVTGTGASRLMHLCRNEADKSGNGAGHSLLFTTLNGLYGHMTNFLDIVID